MCPKMCPNRCPSPKGRPMANLTPKCTSPNALFSSRNRNGHTSGTASGTESGTASGMASGTVSGTLWLVAPPPPPLKKSLFSSPPSFTPYKNAVRSHTTLAKTCTFNRKPLNNTRFGPMWKSGIVCVAGCARAFIRVRVGKARQVEGSSGRETPHKQPKTGSLAVISEEGLLKLHRQYLLQPVMVRLDFFLENIAGVQ